MTRIPKPDDITISIPAQKAESILSGALPYEILLEVSEINNWIIITKAGIGEIFVTCECQTLNLIHWLTQGENVFTIKICNSAPGPFTTTMRYKIAGHPWQLLISIRRSAEVPCIITRNLIVTSPVDFARKHTALP